MTKDKKTGGKKVRREVAYRISCEKVHKFFLKVKDNFKGDTVKTFEVDKFTDDQA